MGILRHALPSSNWTRAIAFGSIFLLGPMLPARGQQQAPVDYTAMPMEDLMDIEVTSVSKKEQKLTQTAAAVYVVTEEDIRRSGATSIPEVLRMVPGLEVARISGNKWAVTARGFNGRYSNKLLVLVDNRPIYDPSFSGVLWEFQDVLMEDIDRIEVIRGPGAAMWGANAVNGVIHIITRQAGSEKGGFVSAGGGDEGAFQLARWEGEAGKNLGYRLYLKNTDADQGLATLVDGNAGDLPWKQIHGGGRADWQVSPEDSLTIEAEGSGTDLDELIHFGTLQTGFGPMLRTNTSYNSGDVSVQWKRKPSDTSDMRLQFFYEEHNYDQAIAIKEGYHVADLDFQYRTVLSPRHELMWGGGFRYSVNNQHNFGNYAFLPPNRSDPLYTGFVQDQISIRPDTLVLTLGTKIEHNNYTGVEVQPGVRLSWTPGSHHELWASVARAVAPPSRVQGDMQVDLGSAVLPDGLPMEYRLVGNPKVGSERMIAYEGGYRLHHQGFALDIAGFCNAYRDLRTLQAFPGVVEGSPTSPELVVPIMYMPAEHGVTYGSEVFGQWQVSGRWRVSGSVTLLLMDLHEDLVGASMTPRPLDGSSPSRQFQVHSYFDLTRKIELDTSFYQVGRIASLLVAAYASVDVRLGWKLTRSLELSLASQNLFNHPHVEFVAEDPTIPTMKIGRTAYAKVTWRF
jgi:iron complex outermembrane receptor protein